MSLPYPADEGSASDARRLKRIPPMNPNAPVLSKEDYFTVPPLKRMRRFADTELQVNTCSMATMWHVPLVTAVQAMAHRQRAGGCYIIYPESAAYIKAVLFLSLMPVQAVERFVVGRKDVGEVAFIGPVDVRGLSLDDIIDIEKGRIQVYGLPGGAQRPPIGHGLNQPALLTFR